MVATTVDANVKVRPWVHSTVYVANELIRVVQTVVEARGLPTDYMHEHGEQFSAGFRYWITQRDLQRVALEVYEGTSPQAVERFDLALDYTGEADDEYFETLTDRVEESLASLRGLHPGCRYRVIVSLVPGAATLPGWGATTLRDTSHLTRNDIGRVIGSPRIGVAMEYWA